jgi:hypothetical protein
MPRCHGDAESCKVKSSGRIIATSLNAKVVVKTQLARDDTHRSRSRGQDQRNPFLHFVAFCVP